MSTPHWPAPPARGPVTATVAVPGSKSLTNRYLVLAALASAPSRLRQPLRARDTELMAAAVRALGGSVLQDDRDWVVEPASLRGGAVVDCGLAGTVMRFVAAMAGLADGPVRLEGDAAAAHRPMGPLVGALRSLGAEVEGDRLPLTVRGRGRLPGGLVELDASASSQFVSALLLAGCRYDEGVTIRHTGPRLPSQPHVDMTVQVLQDAGVSVHVLDRDADGGPRAWQVEPGQVLPLDVAVEPDLSTAAPFLAAAAVTGGQVTLSGWPAHTTQAGAALRPLLEQMGCSTDLRREGLTVAGPAPGTLQGVDVDLADAGELTPVVAALAALAAPGQTSRLTGIGHLRGHETDRLTALATELARLGGEVTEGPDHLVIRAVPLRPTVVRTYGDHRLAQAAAVLGLAVPGVEVENVGTAAKTLPGFDRRWTALVKEDDGTQAQ